MGQTPARVSDWNGQIWDKIWDVHTVGDREICDKTPNCLFRGLQTPRIARRVAGHV